MFPGGLSPVLLRGVLEQLSQLQGVLADLLHGCEQEAVNGDVDHLLQQAAGLKEVPVPALLHQAGQLRAGPRVVVTVLGIDSEALLLGRGKHSVISYGGCGLRQGQSCRGGIPGRRERCPKSFGSVFPTWARSQNLLCGEGPFADSPEGSYSWGCRERLF